MYNVGIDINGYFNGNYSNLSIVDNGFITNGINCDSLPPSTGIEQMSYKLVNNEWVYDDSKFQELNVIKQKENNFIIIEEKKRQLAMSDYKIIKCYESQLLGVDMPYDFITLINERNTIRNEINNLL